MRIKYILSRLVACRLVALAVVLLCSFLLFGVVALATVDGPYSSATPTPLAYHVNAVDEQGDIYTQQFTGTDIESGQLLYARVKASPTPDGATPIGRAPATPNAPAPKAIYPPYHLFMPIQRVSGYSLKVFVLAYISETLETRDARVPITPSVAVDTLTNALITNIMTGTKYHGAGTPMLSFTVFSKTLLYEQTPKRQDGYFDYDALFNRFHICTLVQQGLLDEVWVWGNRESKMNESVVNGPTWSLTTGALPNCGRTLVTMGFNYYRDVSQAMESYSHGLEYMMQLYVPAGVQACDFRTNHYDFGIFDPPAECVGALAINDTYGFTARSWPPVNGNVGGCGWAHQPPNNPDDFLVHQYDYNITTVVQDRCSTWVWGSPTTTSFSCATYGCVAGDHYLSEERFLIWWWQHFPGEGNTDRGRDGQQRPNWWTIKFK